MDLSKLILLQRIDKQLTDLETEKGDLPATVQLLDSRLSSLKIDFENNKNSLDEAKRMMRVNETSIADLYDKLMKFQEQSYSVKTNKEYDAITVEIETTEKKIEENEDKKTELANHMQHMEMTVAEMEKQIVALEKEFAAKQAELKGKLSKTAAEETRLKKEREFLTQQIDKKLLYNYNRIRNGKKDVALAEVENYTCRACFATIPAQKVVEIRMMDKLILCEVCGRILVPAEKNGVSQPLASV